MNAPQHPGYLLLSRTDEWYRQLTSAELQAVIAANRAWVESLFATGKARPGVALAREGATVFAGKRVVLDGPYAESKEAIGGTLVLEVTTLDEAIAIAQDCPSLRHNSVIEVRPISQECPLEACARVREQAEQLAPASV